MNQKKNTTEGDDPSAISDARSDEFYKWVGHSITAWADVETWLFQLCWRSIGSSEGSKKRAAIVYFRTPSLDARIKLVDELVNTVLPKPAPESGTHTNADVRKWNELKKSLKDIWQRGGGSHITLPTLAA